MVLWNFIHNTLGMHFWFLPALIFFIVVVVMFIVHAIKQKNRQNDEEENDATENAADPTGSAAQ